MHVPLSPCPPGYLTSRRPAAAVAEYQPPSLLTDAGSTIRVSALLAPRLRLLAEAWDDGTPAAPGPIRLAAGVLVRGTVRTRWQSWVAFLNHGRPLLAQSTAAPALRDDGHPGLVGLAVEVDLWGMIARSRGRSFDVDQADDDLAATAAQLDLALTTCGLRRGVPGLLADPARPGNVTLTVDLADLCPPDLAARPRKAWRALAAIHGVAGGSEGTARLVVGWAVLAGAPTDDYLVPTRGFGDWCRRRGLPFEGAVKGAEELNDPSWRRMIYAVQAGFRCDLPDYSFEPPVEPEPEPELAAAEPGA